MANDVGRSSRLVKVLSLALQVSAKGPFVYIVKQDSTVEQRAVSLHQRQGELVVGEKRVNSGEPVVTNGQLGVTSRGLVHILQSPEAENPVPTNNEAK